MLSPTDYLREHDLGDVDFMDDIYPSNFNRDMAYGGGYDSPENSTKYVMSDSDTEDIEVGKIINEVKKVQKEVISAKKLAKQRIIGDNKTERPENKQSGGRKRPVSMSNSADSESDVEALLNSLPKSNAGRKKKRVTSNMTKNALAARENRERKKKYVTDLESTVRALNSENKQLKKDAERNNQEMTSLKDSLTYYKSVVSNIGEIRNLVKKLSSPTLCTPLAEYENAEEHQEPNNAPPPGVCVHVKGSKLALKVCSQCSREELC